MRYLPPVLLLSLIAVAAFADSPYLREASQLGDQRERELASAAEPINRRYKEALESLLRRATQAGDLDAGIKLRAMIASIEKPATSTAPLPVVKGSGDSTGKVELTKRGLERSLEQSTWVTSTNDWLQKMVISGGKIIHNPNDKGQGRSAQFHAIDGTTITYDWDGRPCTITFSPDLKTCHRIPQPGIDIAYTKK